MKWNKMTLNDQTIKAVKYLKRNLPDVKCFGCGECCGPTLITLEEYKPIVINLGRQNLWQTVAIKLQSLEISKEPFCPLLLKKGNEFRCMVYRDRPIVCRLQGLITELPCPHSVGTRPSMRKLNKWATRYIDLTRQQNLNYLKDALIGTMRETIQEMDHEKNMELEKQKEIERSREVRPAERGPADNNGPEEDLRGRETTPDPGDRQTGNGRSERDDNRGQVEGAGDNHEQEQKENKTDRQ